MLGCIITGDALRHRYFAKSLSEQLEVSLVAFEKKVDTIKSFNYHPTEIVILEEHFKERDESEKKYFSDCEQIVFPQSLELQVGQPNSSDFFEKIKSAGVDYIVLFGSSLIKDPLLSYYSARIFNLHLGLSPYYKGSGTNFWPLVDGLPECVGATIHLATVNVDGGGILHQLRPNVAYDDTIHDFGNKTIIEATKAIPIVIEHYFSGRIKPAQQDLALGKICRRRDLTAQSVLSMRRNFAKGMLASYIADKQQRDFRYPIVKQGD